MKFAYGISEFGCGKGMEFDQNHLVGPLCIDDK